MLTERDLEARLSDGTAISDLVRVEDRSIAARVLSDPEIHERELEKVFDREWLLVAHESEIPDPGDYVTRPMAEDSVIVTRDEHNQIHVLLNVCSHRATMVCRSECGNTRTFQCPYHAWVYGQDGSLRGIPSQRVVYEGNPIDKAALGLKSARVANYHGMIFATWNLEAPPFEERMATIGFYYDMLFGLTDSGFEVAGPPLRWVENSNWKLSQENFCGDGPHALSVHKSMDDLVLLPGFSDVELQRGLTAVSEPKTGDALSLAHFQPIDTTDESAALLQATCSIGLSEAFVPEIERNLRPEQRAAYLKSAATVGIIFPNLAVLALPWHTGDPNEGFSFWRCLRLAQPYGPDRQVVWLWNLLPRDLEPELKEKERHAGLRMFGSSGMLEQDDSEVWASVQRGARGFQGRQRQMRYYASRPLDSDWPGPGQARTAFPGEDNLLAFWSRWRELMVS